MITKLKAGVTLIELTIVIAIFGILATIATNFLLSTVSTNNRTLVENDVRQSVTLAMSDIASQIRKAGCINFDPTASTLTISESADDAPSCSGGATSVVFAVSSAGVLSKNGNSITSNGVVFCRTTNSCTGSSGCAKGLDVSPSGHTTDSVDLVLSARQKNRTTKRDSCVAISLSETVTPRNASD